MDIVESSERITLEQTYYLAACNQSLARRIGAAINFLLNHVQSYPIGSMVQALVDQTTFQAMRGSGWVLCNGQSASGSAYEALTGHSTVPDTRSSCLRGKNNGRSDGYENPGGDLALGTFQFNNMKPHTHGVSFTNNMGTFANTSPTTAGFSQRLAGFSGPQAAITLTGPVNVGGPSAIGPITPRNIVVNTFIRIN